MARHAAAPVSWLDIIAALWARFVAWLALAHQAAGRHEPTADRTPAGVLIALPARVNWPGAEPDWAAELHEMNASPVVRQEVRA